MTGQVTRGGSTVPSAKSILEARGISKWFVRRGVHALDEIDFALDDGTIAAVIGPSGCGKSTLLKILAGLMPPSTGEVTLSGRQVLGPRREIGMMFQDPTLLPWRTALKNVLLPIEIREGTKAAARRQDKAFELLTTVGLQGFEEVYPHELSGGMAQRVAICRMFITEPAVLLLDEPFGALDELTRERMNEQLQQICTELSATALMVTHSIPEAAFMADIVYVMSNRPGKLIEVVDVDFQRPRTIDMMTESRFGELVRRIRKSLDEGAAA